MCRGIRHGEAFDTGLQKRHEARSKLEAAVERREAATNRLQLFFAKISVKRAERAVLSKEARILEPYES